MINRRSFFGSLFGSLGLFGLSKVIKTEDKGLITNSAGGWAKDYWDEYNSLSEVHKQIITRNEGLIATSEITIEVDNMSSTFNLYKHLYKLLLTPNKCDSFGSLLAKMSRELDIHKECLVWIAPNEYGIPCEIYSIPNRIAVPQHGYWRILDIHPYGSFNSYPTPRWSVIPAKWITKITDPTNSYTELCNSLQNTINYVIQPRCDLIAWVFNRSLIPFFGDNLQIKIKVPKIVNHAEIKSLVKGKAITRNELRNLCGLGYTKEFWGNEVV